MGLAELAVGLEVDVAAMHANLQRSGGLIASEAVMMALAPHIGRHHAHQVLYDVTQDVAEEGGSFVQRLRAHPLAQPLLSRIDVPALVNPVNYLGESGRCVDLELQ